MQLEQKSLDAFLEAVKRLDAGFGGLPAFESRSPGNAGIAVALRATAERLHDNYPYFHPLYAGQMLKPPHPVARLAYALAMWINPNNHALDGGRATSAMEKEAVAEIAAMYGWKEFLGHLCGGGTMANLEALWVGSQVQPGKKILASGQAHYTHQRISAVLQLQFESVACDARGRMDMNALRERVAQGDVGAVVATMGTTATGSVDPLPEILALREKHGFRVHADAAYGGYFALAGNLGEEATRIFARISEADSIVIDPHKHGLEPYGWGCVLFRDPSAGRGAFTNMILRTRTSVPLNCTWARLVWSARGRALRRLRCGRRKSFCRWRGAGSSRGASKAEERRRWRFTRGWRGMNALRRRLRRNWT